MNQIFIPDDCEKERDAHNGYRIKSISETYFGTTIRVNVFGIENKIKKLTIIYPGISPNELLLKMDEVARDIKANINEAIQRKGRKQKRT